MTLFQINQKIVCTYKNDDVLNRNLVVALFSDVRCDEDISIQKIDFSFFRKRFDISE